MLSIFVMEHDDEIIFCC